MVCDRYGICWFLNVFFMVLVCYLFGIGML